MNSAVSRVLVTGASTGLGLLTATALDAGFQNELIAALERRTGLVLPS